MGWTTFGYLTLDGLVIGGIYALTALGLTLVYGLLRVLHVAHAGVYAAGAYCGWVAFSATQSLVLALLFGALGATALGVFLEWWFYRPLVGKHPLIPLIGSIGLFLATGDLLRIVFGPYQKSLPALEPTPVLNLGAVGVTAPQLFVIGATVGLLLVVYWVTARTPLGLAWRSIAQDWEVAGAMGVNIPRHTALAFALASALAGIAGVLVGVYYNQIDPTMGNVPAYKALAIVVLGGLGNVWGTVTAGLLLGVIESFASAYAGNLFPPQGVAFVALILVLLFRPRGLFAR
ncbi:MAG: branched-chain amino acid ABC transporter permease [Gammaproteobacteria bacterium]|nr:branched-chain amino acid ABC transporter permease [Gammaproteobacteria bacterium]NIR83117.1 branched-chain amino acid ABC transporter permease [Gammaproteobacteria bacterium]NIR90779.1 branched-chain amino acid ABC transporter permease [Gammaproteobacteria bacterium]NIU04270.1 branched-chain amino acid ABC transporter permease [Gammaproteobacteria bacterium]NIV51562.1 branched-chain amino acid ABC transporter permease [Gammaproteobacteria bacterium]